MANGRARALGDTTGMVKFLADAKTDEILGVHIIGPMASELIAEAVVAMEFRASAEDIGRICHAHPSLSRSDEGSGARGRQAHAELLTPTLTSFAAPEGRQRLESGAAGAGI